MMIDFGFLTNWWNKPGGWFVLISGYRSATAAKSVTYFIPRGYRGACLRGILSDQLNCLLVR